MGYTPAQKRAYWARRNSTKPTAKIPRQIKNWSSYQNAIFEAIENGTNNIIVNAVPGSSKTTTLVESLFRLPESTQKNSIVLAFNKDIKEELEARVPEKVQAKTFHGFCLGVLSKHFKGVELEQQKDSKINKITTSLVGDSSEKNELREAIAATVALSKATLSNTEEEIGNVIDTYDLNATGDRNALIDYTKKALELCATQNRIINYDDMIWLVYKHNIQCPNFDFVGIDEAQDCSKMRIDIIHRLMSKDSKAAILGDRRQALYAWNGSDSHSMDNLQSSLHCNALPLSISYRCAKKIVEEAKKIEPSIEWSPDAPDGIVSNCDEAKMIMEARAGDFIISRVNAPLIKLCFQLLRSGHKANIQGRDIGRSLTWMIKQSKKDSVHDFLSWLRKWQADSIERIISKNGDPTVIQDKVSCLESLCENASTIKDILNNIRIMFDDNDQLGEAKITLTSAHRSKGKERDRVWLLDKTFKFGNSIDEQNVKYVAITRARSELYFVR